MDNEISSVSGPAQSELGTNPLRWCLCDHSNIVRNFSLHDTRRTNFVLSELLIWTRYALKRMYEVANEIDEEKETLKGDLAAAEAKLATNRKRVSMMILENVYLNL